MSRIFTFAGSSLDRASQLRGDRAWIEAQLGAEDSRFLPFWQLRPLVRIGGDRTLAWARRDVCELADKDAHAIFLGLEGDVAHFAIDLSALDDPTDALGVASQAAFEDPRGIAARLSTEEAAIVAAARSVLEWHRTHGFCPGCGCPTSVQAAGWVRRCAACERDHFPRTDPVVIAAVTRGDRCLLGRQPSWPPGLFSALAGFVEPGESIEAAVRREVYEEAGIEIGDVRYIGAQPWPFPYSLMLGCTAEALSERISLNDQELAEARWFSRAELAAALEAGPGRGSFFLPSPVAIAHHLIRAFIESEPQG